MKQTQTRLPAGTLVRAWKNLQSGTWSVSPREGEDKGRVVENLETLTLTDCTPHYTPSKYRQIQTLGRRKVWARITGRIAPDQTTPVVGTPVHAHPFRSDVFHRDPSNPAGSEWTGSDVVQFPAGSPVVVVR